MNCIIVAEKTNCKALEDFVVRFSMLQLTGTFNEPTEAFKKLSALRENYLVFMDIDSFDIDSFSVLKGFDNRPNIIIVSTNDDFALKAFDFNVIDYLIKPVSYSRFSKAIEKAGRYYSGNDVKNTGDNEIFIKKGSVLMKIKYRDIIFIEALENYVILNTKDEKFTIHFTMKAIEDQLPPGVFVRVHRSFIVNRNLIQSISESSLELLIGNKKKVIPIGNTFRDPLLNGINLITK